MTFNPAESIDFNGNTGPFIQYTYARIKSVFRKAEQMGIILIILQSLHDMKAGEKEIVLIKLLRKFTDTVSEAAAGYSPLFLQIIATTLQKNIISFITILQFSERRYGST